LIIRSEMLKVHFPNQAIGFVSNLYGLLTIIVGLKYQGF